MAPFRVQTRRARPVVNAEPRPGNAHRTRLKDNFHHFVRPSPRSSDNVACFPRAISELLTEFSTISLGRTSKGLNR